MDMQQPPVKPTEIVINRTLPLTKQKSNFEQQLDSFKEELSACQKQFDLCKIELLSCHNKIKDDHKRVTMLTKGVKGFIEDQGRIKTETKNKLTLLDSQDLQHQQSIEILAETITNLQERIEKLEQQNNIKKSGSIPQIIITSPDDTEKNIKIKSNFQLYIDEFTLYKQETTEQLNTIRESIAQQGTAIEENKKNILSLTQIFSELISIIKINKENRIADLPTKEATDNSGY